MRLPGKNYSPARLPGKNRSPTHLSGKNHSPDPARPIRMGPTARRMASAGKISGAAGGHTGAGSARAARKRERQRKALIAALIAAQITINKKAGRRPARRIPASLSLRKMSSATPSKTRASTTGPGGMVDPAAGRMTVRKAARWIFHPRKRLLAPIFRIPT
jgi:hypothetical protein